ncbi:transcription termination/antitermination protein NusG [Sphingomonas sp. 3-13AW]|uniref:transcription termination/antitermination protein NusG n=1 Tax=Sphingomonas sp. 3-13AW TaxID=3050450 RepID=UPI003BB4F74C
MAGEDGEYASVRSWCILRTHGGRTMPLARSLADAGILAWTPVEHVRRRIPRSKEKEREFRSVPYLPTYVFAPAADLGELRRLEVATESGHPAFSIFRHCGASVLVSEAEVASLRQREAESLRRMEQSLAAQARHGRPLRERAEPYDRGAEVAVEAGAFAGLSGTVQESDGRHTLLLFGKSLVVTIDTSTLRGNAVAEPASAA